MRIIELSKGSVTVVDDDDHDEIVAAGKWHACDCNGLLYARRHVYEPMPSGPARSRFVYLHRFLTGWPLVDHINGVTLDNRRHNLRLTTPSQNGQNRGKNAVQKSGFKGVTFHKPSGLWRAQIGKEGRRFSLKYHATPEDAARAYDRAALDLHGEFARTNFPKEQYT